MFVSFGFFKFQKLFQRWEITADQCPTGFPLRSRKPGSAFPKTGDAMKGWKGWPVLAYHDAKGQWSYVISQDQEERFPGTKTKGIQGKAPAQSPPLIPATFHSPPPLPSGTVTRWGAKFPQSVVWQDSSFPRFYRLGLLGFQRGSQGETTCLWCLHSGPEIRTSGENRVYLFHPRQPSWKLLAGTSFSAVLSILSIPTLLREWNSFDWKQGSISEMALEIFFLPFLSPLRYYPPVSHTARCASILFYLLSIRNQLWLVFTQSRQIWGLITFTLRSIGE